MNFKEALIAHLQGECVELKPVNVGSWETMTNEKASHILRTGNPSPIGGWEYRIKPRTVVCNGVEVPAPESVAPDPGAKYYVPMPHLDVKCARYDWEDDDVDVRHLTHGIVYLREEDAIARAKAMLITC